MINLSLDITTHKGNDFEDFLERLQIFNIFKGVIVQYPLIYKQVIQYIVATYSIESEYVVLGSNWRENKLRIYEKFNLPPKCDIQSNIVDLKCDVVRIAIQKWIDFQDDDTYRELIMLRQLKDEMQITAISELKTANGVVDYDQKMKNAKYSIDLNQLIKDAQSNLIQNNQKLKNAHKEAFPKGKAKVSFGVESFVKNPTE